MKKFWKRIGQRKRIKIDEEIKRQQWKKHFRGQFIRVREGGKVRKERKGLRKDEEKEEKEKVKEKVKKIIKNLKKKVTGKDKISNEAFVYGEERMIEIMVKQIKRIWNEEGIPEKWKSGVIKPIYEKGDRSR